MQYIAKFQNILHKTWHNKDQATVHIITINILSRNGLQSMNYFFSAFSYSVFMINGRGQVCERIISWDTINKFKIMRTALDALLIISLARHNLCFSGLLLMNG